MGNKEYIERGALLMTPPFTKFGAYSTWYGEGYLDCAEEARKAVNNAPAADVVEVVRCEDCAVPHNRWTGCPNLNGLIPPAYFYCARGERKEQT